MHRRQLLLLIASSGAGFLKLPIPPAAQQGSESQEATSARIDWPQGLAIDSSGRLYIAEAEGRRVLVLDTSTGKIRAIVGGGSRPVTPGATARLANLRGPTAVAINDRDRLWVVDGFADLVIEVDVQNGRITRVLGGAQARVFERPNGIAISATGEIYIADWVMGSNPPDSRDHGVFRLDPNTSRSTRITGLNAPIKIAPRLLFPSGLVFNSSGLLYVADYENNRIVECDLVNKRAQILVDSNILHPRSLALDGNTLYFTEALPWVRTIDLRTRVLRVVAGGRTPGFAGDGGPAIAAKMVSPFGLAADPMGNLFISDSYDNRIRRVDAKSGVISTVAGNGSPVRPDIRTIPRI